MRIIIACERSGAVRRALRAKGHDAWSCDLAPADDKSPFHIKGDAIKVIENCGPWGGMIGHPPCTFLCNSSVHLLHSDRPQEANRWEEMRAGAYFFLRLWAMPIPLVALENPIMHKYAMDIIQIPYAQLIQPFQFGDPESKGTCLWLRGLPKLNITASQEPDLFLPTLPKPESGHWNNQTASGNNKLGGKEAARLRLNTYKGIADAIADQWFTSK